MTNTPKLLTVGQRFGRLTILGPYEPKIYSDGHPNPRSLCLCDCGNEKGILNRNIVRGLTVSCGCLQREVTAKRSTIHGLKTRKNPHPIYNAWFHMKDRCFNPNGKNWKDYGARGITVCERWMVFDAFVQDMLPSWKTGMMLERVNNDEGYSKENCVWADRLSQNRNKRNVLLIPVYGEKLTKTEIAINLGGNKDLIHVRLRRGWSLDRAISTPPIRS